jgi:hypothetical protein
MKILSILIIAVLVLSASCKKFLDVKPKGKLIPQEIADYNHLLDNEDIVKNLFLDNNLGCMLGYMTDNMSMTEGVAKVSYIGTSSPNMDRYYGYIFREPYQNPNGIVDYFWEWGTYRSMKYFNNVIDGINDIKTTANAAEADAVLAQAYTGRAWAYFHMAMVYGPVYKPAGSNNAKVLPYVTSSDISAPMPDLSTQEEVMTKVLADLHKALPTAPAVTNFPSRPNKVATQAMLAYYHLFSQRYDSVAYYANLAWTAATAQGVDKVLYNFNTLAFAVPGSPLTSAITSPDNKINTAGSRETLLYRASDQTAGRFYPSDEFIALFDQAKDLRYKYFFQLAAGFKGTYQGTTYDDGPRIQYYRGVGRFHMTGGFSYPELLLMRAEGYARTNRLAEAITDLNTLRQYRFVTGTPQLTNPGSQDQVIQMVLDERRRELPLGHIKRFMDLKRFAAEPGKPWSKPKIIHQLGSQTFEANVDSHAFILPISNNILTFNPQWGIPLDTRPY